VLDFSEVTFVDSSGIAVVINALRCMNMLGGKLLLCGIAQQPMKVFRAAGIDKLVEIKEVFA
jgi:stage II sporulation protein AA (anti-sigma F factor antagonist)